MDALARAIPALCPVPPHPGRHAGDARRSRPEEALHELHRGLQIFRDLFTQYEAEEQFERRRAGAAAYWSCAIRCASSTTSSPACPSNSPTRWPPRNTNWPPSSATSSRVGRANRPEGQSGLCPARIRRALVHAQRACWSADGRPPLWNSFPTKLRNIVRLHRSARL